MTSDGTSKTTRSPTDLTLRLNADAEPSGQATRIWPSRSGAYAVLCEMLQGKAGEVEARCRKSKAWWTQGALRWKARVRQDSHASGSHEEANGSGEKYARRDPRQRRHFADELQPQPDVPTLPCMNEFVLLRRVYGRGHLAKVTSALALTASLMPVALKVNSKRTRESEPVLSQTYVVRALKRGRTAIFGADGMHMTNEYEKVRREIAVQSSLQHPNICPLYGVVNDVETGCLHLVLQLLPYPLMEWVEEIHAYTARPLHAGHRREMQPSFDGDLHVLVYTEDAVRRILRQGLRQVLQNYPFLVLVDEKVLDALDYLHSLNIVHKDIKPQNILSAAPPSPDEFILVRLPPAQASRRLESEEGASFLEGPLRRDGVYERDSPPSVALNQDEQEVAAPPRDDEYDREGGSLLDGLVEERAVSCRESDSNGGADVDVSGRARHRLDQSPMECQREGTPGDAPDRRGSFSSFEETSFSETDSDEDQVVCDCGPQCTCTLVAQLPESPAFRTALAVVHNRLSPYVAYACHTNSAVERSAKSNTVASSKTGADVQTSNSHAGDEQTPGCAAADVQLDSAVERNTSRNSTSCSSAQELSRSDGSGALAFAAGGPLKLETQKLDSDTQEGGAQQKLTLREPLSPDRGKLSERCFPTASSPVLTERSSPTEKHSTFFGATSDLVDDGNRITDAEGGDFIVKLARRIVMRRKREGLVRPLFEVVFEGEANVFPVQEKNELLEDRVSCRDVGELGHRSRRAAFLEDAQLVSKEGGLADIHTKVTPLPVQEDSDQTCQGDAGGLPVEKEGLTVRTTQGKKRSRHQSESPDASHDVYAFAESGTSSGLQIGLETKDPRNHVSSVSNPNIELVNDALRGRPTSATNCSQMAGASVNVGGSAWWKLADFNSACVADDDRLTIWDSEGTRHFTPPECLGVSSEEGWAGRPRDLWSVGILLYCMFFGSLPFKGDSGLELSISIMNDTLTFPCHRTLSDSAKDVLRKLLCKDPRSRLTSEQLRRHPWLSDMAN